MAAVLHSEGTLPGMHPRRIFGEASQNLELFAKILPSNENNTEGSRDGLARYLVSAEEPNFSTGEVLFSFVMQAWQGPCT